MAFSIQSFALGPNKAVNCTGSVNYQLHWSAADISSIEASMRFAMFLSAISHNAIAAWVLGVGKWLEPQ